MNYHHHHQYLTETDQSNKPSEVHFHNRSPSGDFLSHQLHVQSDMNSERPKLKERALSDSRLQEHDEGSKYYCEEAVNSLCMWNDGREKSPSLAMSNSSQEPMMWEGLTSEKHQAAEHENQCSFNTMKNTDLNQVLLKRADRTVTCSSESRQCAGNISNDNSIEYKDLQSSDNFLSVHRHQQDSKESGRMVCITRVNALEYSVDNMREHPQGCQSGKTKPAPDFLFKNQNVINDQQCTIAERKSDQQTPGAHHGYHHPPYLRSSNQKPEVQSSAFPNVSKTAASSKLFSFYDEDPLNYPDHKVEIVSISRKPYEGPKIRDAPQRLDDHHENKVLESVVIVEDVTGTTPPDIPFSSRVFPQIEEEATDEFPSHRDAETESTAQGSVSEADGRDTDESIGDAAMAEIEAGIYGLQIIRNADIEELQELGSGTFGTVFYGKWRGTDVAIKRIKKSCFAGRSSEQERLTKDFWREARILSNLHHPNVVAFYGVVPDGPGGTMATVTEYMVNGSLRHVLQKKDKALDRRKKLIIALDAAFGMEYLHLKDIVHFDLKCDNLLVNLRDPQRPICKVGDFGLSRIKHNTLVSGGVRGTLPWMAPELLDGSSNRVSEKVDVYSFGIAMWEILTCEEPYANMHCGAIIGGIVSNTLRPAIPERCDPKWRNLMEECWSFNPAARPSFTEITNKLRAMSEALQTKRRNPTNR
ncbi:hypothetical protein GH714_006055 [Hevea brasiliensis]|uniref:Protein kinase domain-containing protein n=1 Tax=Hevea brasiliensis TaxID=3981 RepID=A0A6A6KDP7_HEVBR|nr:hypothetical protein GH714_006055 [Hevea brasiliensis]